MALILVSIVLYSLEVRLVMHTYIITKPGVAVVCCRYDTEGLTTISSSTLLFSAPRSLRRLVSVYRPLGGFVHLQHLEMSLR